MASQLRDSFNVYSKIFQQKSEHPKVSWNALAPWSSTGHCLSRSSDLARNTIPASSVLAYAIVYSGVLWIISPFLTRSLFERAGGFRMTERGLAVSFLAHNVYGVFLGLLIPLLG